ncbi:MAG: hypothetical protein FWC47_08680 [Oscillospiraceae bacterium]|nr:hypothetical protein [Oscillospiraceae bacterium]
MAKKKTTKKTASLKKYQGKLDKNVNKKKTLYETLDEKINFSKFAVPIWGLGIGLFLFLLMFLINGWMWGLVIGGAGAIFTGIGVYIINK